MGASDAVRGNDAVGSGYDRVARRYAEEFAEELITKPVDRALYALFAELVRAELDANSAQGGGRGPRVGDIGCGIGHITHHLAGLGLDPIGIDPSPGMIEVARERYPEDFAIGTFEKLPVPDRAWAGAVAPYSVIHVDPERRPAAFAELARVIRPRGWFLLAFHVESTENAPGTSLHVVEWWGQEVDLLFHYLDPATLVAELASAGLSLVARTDREPWPGVEHQSRRCYLLARRS